ncbi:MAG: CHAT domain-containing protein [Dehalococcoidia bacterium]
MALVQRSNGITIDLPAGLELSEPAPTVPRRRGPAPAAPARLIDINSALASSNFSVLDQFTVERGPARPGRRAAPAGASASVSIELPPDEAAVVLVEEDGVFAWRFANAAAPTGRRRRGTPTGAVWQFDIDLGETAPAAPGRRGLPIIGKAIERATATVLRFVLPTVIDHVVDHLERDRHEGLVAIQSADPQAWSGAPVAPGGTGRTRVLLFIHGTFSSTRGGFGALGATPWGQALLNTVLGQYDMVIGYDHKTLSLDPRQNAEGLLAELQALWPAGDVDIDVVCHSRGGLVYRSLVETLLPVTPWPAAFGKVVFVAAANSGTELANSANWARLADLYTNLAAMSARGLAIIVPGAGAAGLVLAELLDGVGTLVKTIVSSALNDGDIPGLAAMQPTGKFITSINAAGPGPTPGTSSYFAVLSNFEPDLRSPDTEIPERLIALLKDGLIDQLLGADNDMVVDLASMTRIDPGAGDYFDERFDFGTNGAVHHTNYFHQPQTSRAISEWLGLDGAASRGRRRRSAGRITAPQPVEVSDDFVIIEADRPLDDLLLDILNQGRSEFIVIDRYSDVKYAFRRHEFAELVARAEQRGMFGAPIGDAFELHEGDRSELRRDNTVVATAGGATPAARRTIILDGDRPVGVRPLAGEALTAEQLAQTAAPIGRPREAAAAEPDFSEVPAEAVRPVARNGHSRAGPPRPSRPRRPTRGGGRIEPEPAAAEPEPPPGEAVSVNVGAWTDAELELAQPATLTVNLSREAIELPAGAAAGMAGIAAADPARPLLVMCIGRKNLKVTGKSTQSVPVPAEGETAELFFGIEGTTLGDAQVDVIVRQTESPLAKITLKPQVVRTVTSGARAEAAAVASAGPAGPPRHQLYISEIQDGNATRYHFHLELLRPGEPPEPVEADSNPLRGEKASYVSSLYKRIEDMWGDSRDKIDEFARKIRAEGGALWDELIPEPIQRHLWANREAIGFIQVYSDEPFIPWELIHMKEPGKRTLPAESWFLAELGVVRWILSDDSSVCTRAPGKLRVRPGKVSAIVPDYPAASGWQLQSTQADLNSLEAIFGAVGRVPSTFNGVVAALTAADFDLLHYAGHGVGDSSDIGDESLVLSVMRNGPRWEPDSTLGPLDVLSNASLSETPCAEFRPIVVLNCCETGRSGYTLTSVGGFAGAFLKAGAGVIVSPLWSVDDVAAGKFTQAFYASLRRGDTLAAAARAARVAIRDEGDQTWLAYTIYGEPTATLV